MRCPAPCEPHPGFLVHLLAAPVISANSPPAACHRRAGVAMPIALSTAKHSLAGCASSHVLNGFRPPIRISPFEFDSSFGFRASSFPFSSPPPGDPLPPSPLRKNPHPLTPTLTSWYTTPRDLFPRQIRLLHGLPHRPTRRPQILALQIPSRASGSTRIHAPNHLRL